MPSLHLRSLSTFPPTHLHYTLTTRPFLFSLLSSYSSLSKPPNPLLLNYLTKTLDFPATRALTIASITRYSNLKSLEKPQAVVQYFQNHLGFSEKQIQSLVRLSPQILFLEVDKILKPKIKFFQQLGLADAHLGKFFSKTSSILTLSLEKKLIPSVEVLKKILENDKNNKDLFRVLSGNFRLVGTDMDSKLLPNIRLLESCGIIGDQLAMLLRRSPRLFTWKEAALRNIVTRVSDLGIDMHSRMFVHAFCAVSGSSDETFKRKVQTFERFGFSKDEYMLMARKAPNLLKKSTKSSIIGLDFYLNTVKFKKEVLLCNPKFLMFSMENRVIPRYRVLEIIKCKRLLKKEPSFSNVLNLREDVFLERFVSKLADHEEELLKSYKDHTMDFSSEK